MENKQIYTLEIRGKDLARLGNKDLSKEIALGLEKIDIPVTCYVYVEKQCQ